MVKDYKLTIIHALVILEVGVAKSGAFEDFCFLNPNTSKLLVRNYFPSLIGGLLNIHHLYLRIKLKSTIIFSIRYPHQLFRINISLNLVGYYRLNQCYRIHQLWRNASKLKRDSDHPGDFFQRKMDGKFYQLQCNLLGLRFHFSSIYHLVYILFESHFQMEFLN